MEKKLLILISLIVFGFWSCKKDQDDPAPPIIEFKSISSSDVQSFNNAVLINFSYEDFQGDLGNNDPDIFTLRIKDDRLNDFDWYHIPPMTPGADPLHIKGTYTVELNPLFLLGNGGNETTKFTLQIRDRAGNWSNQIVSPAITIHE